MEVGPSETTPLVLHFWATWCPSCGEEFGQLARALRACPAGRVEVYAVNVGDPPQEIAAFVERHGVSLPVLRDPHGRVWKQADGRGLPANLFWSWPDQRTTHAGPMSYAQWRARLAELGCPAPADGPRDDRIRPD